VWFDLDSFIKLLQSELVQESAAATVVFYRQVTSDDCSVCYYGL